MEFDLNRSIRGKGILIAAHRGVNGGNIPCNSLSCYLAAVNQGADIIEMDVTACRDAEELYMLHPGMERVHTTLPDGVMLGDLSRREVEQYFLRNQDLTPTQYRFVTFGETLDALKGKCYINVDKFWDNPKKIAEEIRRREMQDQVIVKSDPNNGKIMDLIEEYAPDMQFLAIVNDPERTCHDELCHRNINYVGTEILFDRDDHPFIGEDYIRAMHREGRVVWVNSIVFDHRAILAGDHTDDRALLGDPDGAWGFFGEKKIDIIQTDWLLACRQYLERKGYRK